MDASALFSSAHALARKVRQSGDDYRVTFGACLKSIVASVRNHVTPTTYRTSARKDKAAAVLVVVLIAMTLIASAVRSAVTHHRTAAVLAYVMATVAALTIAGAVLVGLPYGLLLAAGMI